MNIFLTWNVKLFPNYFNFSELKNGSVTVSSSSTSPALVIGLIVSVIFNLVVGGYVLSQVAASERMENR